MSSEEPPPPPPRLCPQCGEALKVIIKLFDQNKGRTVRVFRCLSGHVVWDDDERE
jgi:hypothetical protein